MCGIVGYIGNRDAYDILIKGLHRLEYRGYDSAGVAIIDPDNRLNIYKSRGKVDDLENFCQSKNVSGSTGIAHTRWATHGEPNDINAHPHYSASGKIALQEYEIQKTRIQKQISEYQSKLEDKAGKLQEKEQELERLTRNVTKARSVVQPFRNHKVDFMPPRITEKVPLFGTDKWVERQNRYIAKHFTEIVRKIESLYKIDAVRQVEAAQHNVLADYGEFYRLKRENLSLLEINQELESE